MLDGDYKVVAEVKRYLQYLDRCGKSPNTLKSYACDLLLYYRYAEETGFNVMDLCKDPERGPVDILSSFMFWLQYPLAARSIICIDKEKPARSDRSVNRIMSTVLGFYQYLSSNKQLEELDLYKAQRTSPQFKTFLSELVLHRKELMKTIFYKKTPDKKVEALSRENYNKIYAACNLNRDRLLLALMFECGLRVGEAVGLHLEDVERIEEGKVFIVPRENNENGARVKNCASGTVFPPAYVIDLLIEYLVNERPESGSPFVFLTAEGPTKGKPMNMSAAKRLMERLSAKTGIKVHAHMLRHGFAQEKLDDLDNGWSLEQVQAYLRHKNVTSTQIYAQYTDKVKREKMRSFIDTRQVQMDPIAEELLGKKGD